MYLVVGLGNPGLKYSGTKHNIGFNVVDSLAERLRAEGWKKRFKGACAEGRSGEKKILMLKPETYMNRSGESVLEALRYYNIPESDLIVIHDEMDLPFGQLRVKSAGGSAGHNGIASITHLIGSGGYQRVRVGIAKPAYKKETVNYVLSGFSKAEKEVLEDVVYRAADAVLEIIENGPASAMNKFNMRAETEKNND